VKACRARWRDAAAAPSGAINLRLRCSRQAHVIPDWAAGVGASFIAAERGLPWRDWQIEVHVAPIDAVVDRGWKAISNRSTVGPSPAWLRLPGLALPRPCRRCCPSRMPWNACYVVSCLSCITLRLSSGVERRHAQRFCTGCGRLPGSDQHLMVGLVSGDRAGGKAVSVPVFMVFSLRCPPCA
jgi:hypothetical protein